MLTRLLLHLNLAVCDLDLIARALAADLLRVHDVDVLAQYGTVRELRRRYAMLAVETGLPIGAQERVSEMAWGYIAAAQDEPQAVNRKEFSFY